MNTTTISADTSSGMAVELLRDIQQRNYGAAETKARQLWYRLNEDAHEQRRTDQAIKATRLEARRLAEPDKIVMHGEDETVIAEIAGAIRALPDGTPLSLRVWHSSDEADMERLERMRECAVGIPLKEINHKIAKLQNQIDNRRRKQNTTDSDPFEQEMAERIRHLGKCRKTDHSEGMRAGFMSARAIYRGTRK